MASIGTSKTSCKHSCDKCLSPGASNISLDESDVSIRANDLNINGNCYVNTPSPSSIESISTIDRSFKHRSSNFKKDNYHPHMSSKRRYRHDKLFHYTHSLNRQYVITMTNILFQMQKEIFKLKRRAHHIEQMLDNQTRSGNPIIRIPRLTRDEISTICINGDENQQTITPNISEENENNNQPQPTTTNEIKTLNEHEDNIESSIPLQTESEENVQINNQQTKPKNKYCSECQHEFSHRSAYLRHMRKIHQGKLPIISNNNNSLETDNSHNITTMLTTDKSVIYSETENGIESELMQVLINQWDIGERLRPRPTTKLNNEPITKVKCDICNKYFRTEYIKKHKRRTHRLSKSPSSNELIDTLNPIKSTIDEPMDQIQTTTTDESPAPNTDPPSTITIAEMDVDDIPIRFRKDTHKPIVIAVTCLERYQSSIIEEFLQKFSSRVSQVTSIDSRTTHLITNDEQHLLRSPLSMKLIEAIAHHCYCVSYRWILDCLKYDRIIDESPYEIESDNTDLQPHGGPKRSRLIDKRHSLFENICFMIKCTDDKNNKMKNDRLQDLITTCGGRIINCVTQDLLNQYKIVVLCDKVYVSEHRHNYDQCYSLGILFLSSDWVLESILEYRQKPFSLYKETPS